MGNYYNNMMGYGNAGWLGFGFGWIFMIIFWALVIWGIIALVRYYSGYGHSCCGRKRENEKRKENNALEILKERYAKGEINKNEFETKKKVLM